MRTVNVIRKVWERKASGQKLVTIPKDCDIETGDHVKIIKIEDNEDVTIE